jgi:hypothetical protein
MNREVTFNSKSKVLKEKHYKKNKHQAYNVLASDTIKHNQEQ